MEYPTVSYDDLKIKIPSGIVISGPSSSGKTELMLRILQHSSELFDPPPKAIGLFFYLNVHLYLVWVYGEFSKLIPRLEREGVIVNAGMPSDEMLNRIPKPFVLVIDDMMGEIDPGKLAALFTKKSHHNNFTVVFLSQNLFDKSMRVPRTNAQYIILMRAPVGLFIYALIFFLE